jgi:hypothetical protein
MDGIQTIVALVGGQAVVLLGLGFLFKSAIAHWLTKDIESFKIELQSAASRELEGLRNSLQRSASHELERLRFDLNLSALEHQILFSKLHDRRADVIAEIDRFLAESDWNGSQFSSSFGFAGDPPKHEQFVTAQNKFVEFFRYVDSHRVWLPPPLATQLEEFIKKGKGAIWDYGHYVTHPGIENTTDGAARGHAAWKSLTTHFYQEVPKARRALEREMRIILGDRSDDLSQSAASPTGKTDNE